MYDKSSLYPKIETGFAFKPQRTDVCIEAFNTQSFNQNGKESAISKKLLLSS